MDSLTRLHKPFMVVVLSIQRKVLGGLRIGRILTIRIGGSLGYSTKLAAS